MTTSDKKIFAVLFFSIFVSVTGVGIVVPLLPVYAYELGASGLYIGLVFGAFSLSRTFFLPYFGRLSDKKGRKPLIVAGLLAYALISIGFILSKNVETLIIMRFIQGISSAMLIPVIQAYVGDITPEGSEGLSMGMFNMSMFFGLSLGPLAGGMINEHFSLNTSFLCMGILAFLGFSLCLFLLPPTKSERAVSRKKEVVSWKKLLRDKDLAGLFLFRFAYAACVGVVWGFLPVLADSEFHLSSSYIGILVMLGVFIAGVMQTPMGYMADRFNKRIMILIGGFIIAFAILLFNWADGFGDLFIANVLIGIGGGIAMPALMALAVLKGNTTKAMGSVMGIITMAHSSGMLTGSLVAGLMMDMFQLRHAFSFGSLIMILGTGLFFFYTYHMKEKPLKTE
ncbi:MAG: MFS transporter [Thermodesulfobacteriota bacterium]|nr:MFS transporter [Thermodesulfobacteriota bacterium]